MPPRDPERLEELLADALAAQDAGGDAAVSAFLAMHPQERAAIERGLARARQMGLAGAAAPVADFPDRLGEFRLLRRLGSGGMGVVYEAEQQSLSRRVALKLVRPELLYFEGARERFRREIEAVARLQHPAIVPVLASGEQDGVPFYAMELLHGRTVHEVTAALRGRDPALLRGADLRAAIGADGETGTDPLQGPWWQICTRLIHNIALGVRHAHLRGIVHRDIKPSNVMLTTDGRTVLLDFGVALVGGNREFTRTGNTPGSPAFMSPEQLRGDAVDERTDVYSLAATLWQMLTLQPPFPPTGDVQKVLAGELRSPLVHNRELPRELELVVRTAMDVDRERRYADMQAFADDLQAVLQRRPIRARRLGVGLRLLRWSQRHRITATMIACLLVVAAILPGLFAWRERALSHELMLAAQRADASLELSLDAIYSLLVRVGEERLRYVPAARQAAIESLTEACALYRQLLPQHPDNVRLHVDAGKTMSRLADLQARDGAGAAALATLREGRTLLGGTRAEVPLPMLEARVYLALNEARLGDQLGTPARATEALAAAEADLERLRIGRGDELDLRRQALECQVVRGDTHFSAGDLQAAEDCYRQAMTSARQLAAERPGDAIDAQTAVNRLDALATLLVRQRRREEARPLLDDALALARGIPVDARIWPPQPFVVSHVLETLGNLLVDQRDLAAVPLLKECLQLREQVAKDHPSDLMVRSDVAAALHNLARMNFYQAQDDLVVERLQRAAELQRQVLAELPSYRKATDYLLNHLSLLGTSLAKLGRRQEVERCATELAGMDTTVSHRRAARLWLRCLGLLQSTQSPPDDADAHRQRCLDQAMANLLAAEKLGWGRGSAFTDDVYDPLRELPGFQALQQRLAARQSAAVSPPSTSNASREMPR